jgi:uncharacterized membrane protein
VELVNVALWVLGIALIAIGYLRAKGPWARYQGLKSQQDNVARYEAWRGGVRDGGTSGATVMMDMARREARLWGAVAIVGFVLVFAGFLLR